MLSCTDELARNGWNKSRGYYQCIPRGEAIGRSPGNSISVRAGTVGMRDRQLRVCVCVYNAEERLKHTHYLSLELISHREGFINLFAS